MLNKNSLSSIIQFALLGSAIATTHTALASDTEYHDADPRNSSARLAVFADDAGELKLLGGGGASGLTSDISQTIGFAEYYTQSNNTRLRAAHFDSFGGLYLDLYHFDDAATMYTTGYMLPLSSRTGTLVFPSLNYTYVNFDSDGLANRANSQLGNGNLPGTVSDDKIESLLNGGEAHLGSLNLYVLHAWDDTHYSLINANLGSSYSGVDMQVANLMWLQGMKTTVADKEFNLMLELKYDVLSLSNSQLNKDETFEEVTASIGVEYRF